ncbi:MAG: hypothetical protein ABL897_13635 [Hyphomicrobium sp.]
MAKLPGCVSVGFVILATASAIAAVSAPARADDAYLCGPDKVVYVAVADLEMKKRTDPCIAAYYGLKVDEASLRPDVKSDTKATTKSAAAAGEQKPVAARQAALKPLTDNEIAPRPYGKGERQASLEPPRALPGTDYRNVKILNAASPDNAWYRHAR